MSLIFRGLVWKKIYKQPGSQKLGLKIKNGYKYAQAGYVPVLFCKMRRSSREAAPMRVYKHQSEFIRHPRVFLTIGEADSLGMFWKLSRKDVDTFSGVNFLKCKDFFSGFPTNRLYTNTDFANILCKTEYNTTTDLPVYVHTYRRQPLHRAGENYVASNIRSWKFETRANMTWGDDYNVDLWMLRKLEFEFKIGFCPNYFSYRNPNTKKYIKYDPAKQFQSDYFYYHSDYVNIGGDKLFYDECMDTTTEFPIEINHRYQLSDCVSNIVTFKCISSAGKGGSSLGEFKLVVC